MLEMIASGSTSKMDAFLQNALMAPARVPAHIQSICEAGVHALAAATPERSGATAEAWDYEIVQSNGLIQINWINTHQNEGQYIAVLIQYGHGTRNGGYVQGYDYINPAMKPIFDQIADQAFKAVTT